MRAIPGMLAVMSGDRMWECLVVRRGGSYAAALKTHRWIGSTSRPAIIVGVVENNGRGIDRDHTRYVYVLMPEHIGWVNELNLVQQPTESIR